MRTCDHWRTAWPTCSPASRTMGRIPCSSTWAAAARPTGPAPITATVLGALDIVFILLDGSNIATNASGDRIDLLTYRSTIRLRAALVHQEANEAAHDGIV